MIHKLSDMWTAQDRWLGWAILISLQSDASIPILTIQERERRAAMSPGHQKATLTPTRSTRVGVPPQSAGYLTHARPHNALHSSSNRYCENWDTHYCQYYLRSILQGWQLLPFHSASLHSWFYPWPRWKCISWLRLETLPHWHLQEKTLHSAWNAVASSSVELDREPNEYRIRLHLLNYSNS